MTLLTDRAIVTLSIGSTFRTMTQSALLTFLPVYLARDMGYSPLWIGACMFALQAAGFIAAPIAGHLSDTIGRRQIIVSSMSMTAVVIIAMAFAGGTIWFVLLIAALGFFLFAVRAVLQAWLLDAAPPHLGGQRDRHFVRRSGRRRCDRADLRRPAGRSVWHHGGVLFPGRDHRDCQSDDLRDADVVFP